MPMGFTVRKRKKYLNLLIFKNCTVKRCIKSMFYIKGTIKTNNYLFDLYLKVQSQLTIIYLICIYGTLQISDRKNRKSKNEYNIKRVRYK